MFSVHLFNATRLNAIAFHSFAHPFRFIRVVGPKQYLESPRDPSRTRIFKNFFGTLLKKVMEFLTMSYDFEGSPTPFQEV